MPLLSYSGYRFPRDIIQRAVWMYLRFTLSFRDVEEHLAERGITVSHETIRRWVLAFGPTIARRLRARRLKPHSRWHIDESGDRGERGCPCPQSHAEAGTPDLRQRHLNSTGPASVRPLPRSMQHSRSERLS